MWSCDKRRWGNWGSERLHKVTKPESNRAGICTQACLLQSLFQTTMLPDGKGIWEAQRDVHFLTKEEVFSVTSPTSLAETIVLLYVGCSSVPHLPGAVFLAALTKVPLLFSKGLPNKYHGHLIICQLCYDCIIASIKNKNKKQITCYCGN